MIIFRYLQTKQLKVLKTNILRKQLFSTINQLYF
ncbi:hypothetical protein Runsl_4412 [Runella slithyformis DSM 19594]|uniref:Uncharacterized protein n=1 Tax=Runella slithyformis (strain ATCC 29530 / DSM 19594 / LMG 11500 / NCIMB 11436 / LSU 4) TaxID=761193 RepID=A0A7U4E7J4_RUNSL|nr:hypothetical protein Runsl_4412 [Runella slithyformis DSM 19594]